MKKILVGTDFSEASRNAAEYACELAKIFNAEVHLAHAYYIPAPIGDAPGYIPLSMAEVDEEKQAQMQRETEFLAGKSGVSIIGHVSMGMATDGIKELCKETGPELVVMGMKGEGRSSAFFGSTAIEAMRRVKQPLLIVPGTVQFKTPSHIVFASDFGELPAFEKFTILRQLLQQFNADLQILHVQKDEEMDADAIAGKLSAQVFFDHVNHSFETIKNESIEEGILEYVKTHDTGILVMVARHHSFFERLFKTNHTKFIAYRSSVPLLVLHDE